MIHVEVTCIKGLGIDGLSGGDFLEGVLAGKYPLEMLPLYIGALDRAKGI